MRFWLEVSFTIIQKWCNILSITTSNKWLVQQTRGDTTGKSTMWSRSDWWTKQTVKFDCGRGPSWWEVCRYITCRQSDIEPATPVLGQIFTSYNGNNGTLLQYYGINTLLITLNLTKSFSTDSEKSIIGFGWKLWLGVNRQNKPRHVIRNLMILRLLLSSESRPLTFLIGERWRKLQVLPRICGDVTTTSMSSLTPVVTTTSMSSLTPVVTKADLTLL